MNKKYYSLVEENNEATLNIYGEITSWEWSPNDISSYTLSKQLESIEANTINVYINSYGGEVAEGLAIYNALKRHKAKVITYVDGFACSIASVIFMAGDERIMSNSSLLMIHNAWAYTAGNANELRKMADDLDIMTQASINAYMLDVNIKTIRKSKGLSQQELAVKLDVVRQTISKWEQGLSVPDSDMLISISEVLETPVSTLLGENVIKTEVDELKAISAKLEVINLQLAKRKTTRKRIVFWILILLCIVILSIFAVLLALESPYSGWNYSDPETAVLGTAFHSFEWLFVRVAPIILIGTVIGIFLTRKKE